MSKRGSKSSPTKSGGGIADLAASLQARKQTSVALCEGFFAKIEEQNSLNAFIHLARDGAMRQAKESDERIRQNQARPLEGVPISIKINMAREGLETTAGSRILEGFVPTYTATVVQRMIDAGAVILGNTNMDEFGMGSSTENSCYGPTINPVGVALGIANLSPGGSSGGGAAAVAAELCMASLATDTGGSIRQPASFCGMVGFKPSYGLCSRWGIIAYASSFDQAGPICRSVADAAVVLDTMMGEDAKDSTSMAWSGPSLTSALQGRGRKWRVGFPKEFRDVRTNPAVEGIWKTTAAHVEAFGGEVVEVSLPHVKYALPAYYILVLSEASSNLARYDGVRYGHRSTSAGNILDLYENSRAEGFSHETKKRILLGTYTLSAGYYDQYYEKARKVRTLIAGDFAKAFERVDTLVWPTAPTPPFPLGSHAQDPLTMYLEDVFTVPVNLAGLPALSLPVGTSAEGLPLGLTVAGPHLGDAAVACVAREFERAVQGH